MKYTIVTLCRDANGMQASNSYLEKGVLLKEFDSKREAFEFAVKAAEEEAEGLMEGCREGISFGVPEDTEYQNMESVKVCYYNHEDDTTEIITERALFGKEQQLIPGRFYDLDGDPLPETPALDELCIMLAKMSLLNPEYPEYITHTDDGELDNDAVMALAKEIKENRYCFLDPIKNLADDFIYDKEEDKEV
ncbi:MAG: hypothetical protein IKO10_18300 [Lachnospiraceae bacterium]|nr:hypothetical protein [Lachnospiraceae bacterium]